MPLASALLALFVVHAHATPASTLAAPEHDHGRAHDHGAALADAGVVYTCSMHPEVQSPSPGKCPKCGMKLTPKAAIKPEHATT